MRSCRSSCGRPRCAALQSPEYVAALLAFSSCCSAYGQEPACKAGGCRWVGEALTLPRVMIYLPLAACSETLLMILLGLGGALLLLHH